MLKLLKTEDREVLGKSNFAKNAVFYKDLQAFCEAYGKIIEQSENLPSFCYDQDKNLCLEGLCLLMKMYASEFMFETMKLTLDYLRILYFAMASYAEDNGEVDVSVILDEFHEYRRAGEKFCSERKDDLIKRKNHARDLDKRIKEQTKKTITLKTRARVCSVLAAILFVVSTLAIFVPVTMFSKYSLKSVQFWVSTIAVIFGFVVTIVLKVKSKTLPNVVSDLAYHIQNIKKDFENESEELGQCQSKYNKIFCEKSEYENCFSVIISKFGKTMEFDEIINNAKNYKLLSYNLAYDISRLFKSQQKEIDQIIYDINTTTSSMDFKGELANIYERIAQQDWLYYNLEIRHHFLNKFIEFGEKDFDWKIAFNGDRINPFDIDAKAVAQEEIAFIVSKAKKPIVMKWSDFTKTKYYKENEDLNLKDGALIDSIKRVKTNYLAKFYNAKIAEKFKDTKELEEFERVPTLVNLKLKLIEENNGLGNSDAKVIKDISQIIFAKEKSFEREDLVLKESDIEYPKFTALGVEETDDTIIYDFGGTKKVGYKIN